MVKSCVVVVVGGGPWENTVSSLGQVIVIVISRPRSLTIVRHLTKSQKLKKVYHFKKNGKNVVQLTNLNLKSIVLVPFQVQISNSQFSD